LWKKWCAELTISPKLTKSIFLYLFCGFCINKSPQKMCEKNRDTKLREHLANERTYLAWIRTSVALMGLGFVIVKFALFLKEITVILDNSNFAISEGSSAVIGVVMVALGVVLAIFAFFQYKKVEKQINRQTYKSSSPVSTILTLAILIGGIILVIDLLTSISFN